MKKSIVVLLSLITLTQGLYAQLLNQRNTHTAQDTLRGSIGPAREWWDVVHYNVEVEPDYGKKYIRGFNEITIQVLKPGKKLQIDLQEPMQLTAAVWDKKNLSFTRDGNVFYIEFPAELAAGSQHKIRFSFAGNPRVARNAPWDGGWIFAKDEQDRPWMTVACQGLGASVWLPLRDHQSAEPSKGVDLTIIVPQDLIGVGNGRLISEKNIEGNKKAFHWKVTNPINSYNIIPYIGHYVHFGEKYAGVKGSLDLDYWVLDYNLEKAQKQFTQVPVMMKCFEEWFGPYPFYEDSYKLVESSHLGMEHQSAVAYGNKYQNGYLGRDLSGTGHGLKWDYIIIHETGHEWFGNNITTKDIADMWVHEGFTTYSEVVYTECLLGKEAATDYAIGLRRSIGNRSPIIGPYGVNKEGASDMYSKGANIIHTLRQISKDDDIFKACLLEMNKRFYHKTIHTSDVERLFSEYLQLDLSKVFDFYLRSTGVPELEYYEKDGKLFYRWTKVNEGFDLPIVTEGKWTTRLTPTTEWQNTVLPEGISAADFKVNRGMYIKAAAVSNPS